MAGVPLGHSLGHGELDVEGICSEPGVACANCTMAVTCVPLPFGFLKVRAGQISIALEFDTNVSNFSYIFFMINYVKVSSGTN